MRVLAGIAIALVSASAFAADVIDELLKVPPPPIPVEEHLPTPPPDDAPLDVLIAFWAWNRPTDVTPTAVVRERLVDAIEQDPESLPYIVDLFSPADSICSRVKHAVAEQDEDAPGQAAEWIVQQCASERERLLALALDTTEDEAGVVYDDNLRALANRWADAEPVLRQLARSQQKSVRTAALSLLYEHDATGDLRRELQAIAIDAEAAYPAREQAIQTLASTQWDSRDEWLISLMREPSAAFALPRILGGKPQWIPIMRAFLQSSDRVTHSAAANALAQFARADAIVPLLPWLDNETWADETGNSRSQVMENAGELGLADAIPGLIANLADPSFLTRYSVVRALGKFNDPRVHDALRKALGHDDEPNDLRQPLVAALLASGGWTPEERAESLFSDVKPLRAQFFLHLLMQLPEAANDDVARVALARVRELQPALAAKLLARILPWDVPSVNAFLFERIEDGSADAQTIAAALMRRDSLREHYATNVRRLVAKDGIVRGIGVVLAAQQRLLSTADIDALRAMLASARITRDRFAIDIVTRAFGVSAALDRTVEAYLVAEDSREARAIVQRRHTGELLILGEGGRRCTDWEATLLDRFHESKADELFALRLCNQANPSPVEILIKSDGVLVNGATRSAGELADLREFVTTAQFDDLGAIGNVNTDVPEYEYIHLTRSSGRRVVMNVSASDSATFGEMMRRMTALAEPTVR